MGLIKWIQRTLFLGENKALFITTIASAQVTLSIISHHRYRKERQHKYNCSTSQAAVTYDPKRCRPDPLPTLYSLRAGSVAIMADPSSFIKYPYCWNFQGMGA
jgi:hypothetical protein